MSFFRATADDLEQFQREGFCLVRCSTRPRLNY